MGTVSGVIVGFWFLPLVLLIALPLALLGVWLLVRGFSKVFAGSRLFAEKRAAEKRAHQRVSARELRADVSDGQDFFTGLTCNISRMGICIMGLPEKFLSQQLAPLAVVVNGHGEEFALNVLPRWQKVQQSEKKIGALIQSSPDSWNRFVQRNSSPAQP